MGQGEIRSPFACAQCKNMRRLIDFILIYFAHQKKIHQLFGMKISKE
uniref:Uncharacterized protein n=1 Tax=Marseillevirus LCMAC102 TaxID=2506603 RepID=A0A481YUP3_9VIRU|nr:MAG: hypothetical protein LCMAC102_04540 [Marseillevirus LCMAC102]